MSQLKTVEQHKVFWTRTIAVYEGSMHGDKMFGPLLEPYNIAKSAMKEIEHKKVPNLQRLDKLLAKHNECLANQMEEE